MSKEQYLMMCEQTGMEIDWDKCPEELEDFPDLVHTAMNVFYTMGDRVYPDIGYIGKDFTMYDNICNHYFVEDYEKDFLYELILFLEQRTIESSQQKLKAEMDRIKRK
ncbi:hypothetical protein OAG26_00965 [Flavobacteriales bacterium]|nr:hypothetical protein [Flavobacteriales bacterium]